MNDRTCVGCKARTDRSALLRVVAFVGQQEHLSLLPDERGRLPGRGAWLHPQLDCFDEAVRRRAFVRALRLSAAADVRALRTWIAEHAKIEHLNDTSSAPDRCSADMTEGGFDADEHPMSTQR